MRCWRQIKDTFPLSSLQFRGGGFDLIQFPSNLPPSRTLECARLRVKCRMGGWGKSDEKFPVALSNEQPENGRVV